MPAEATEKGRRAVASVSTEEVGSRTRSGIVWSVLQVAGRNGLSIGTTAVLARLLSPEDYGLMGMVSTLTALLLAFSDMGLSWATVQRRDLTEAQASNLFWLNTSFGVVMWGLCLAAAPWMARFYGHPELEAATSTLGAGFLLTGIAAQPMALLTRRMQFKKTAAVELAAIATGAATGISCALAGYGFWSLIFQSLAAAICRTVLVVLAARPHVHLPRRGTGTRSLVTFGGTLAVNGLMIYFARNLDNVVVGKFWGSAALGYYGRAYFLMLLPSTLATSVLTNLMVPSLSAFQNDPERLGRAYRRAVRLIAFAGFPLSAGLALTSHEAVQLVYGETWLPVVPMLVWLSIAGLTQPVYNTTGWLFVSSGKARSYLLLTVSNALVLTTTFLVAVQWSAVAVAAGYGIVMGLLLLWPALSIAHRAAGIPLAATLRVLRPAALCVAGMAAAVFAAGAAAAAVGLVWKATLVLKVAVGVATYLLLSRLLLREMWTEDVLPMLPAPLRTRASRWLGQGGAQG